LPKSGVLLRPKLMRLHGLNESQIKDFLVELTANAIWHEPSRPIIPAPDRGDDPLWALLTAHAGRILITGDQLLLNNPPERSSVISSATYLHEFVPLGRSTL
jgi:predicted nucleic acid-binding protein